MTPDQERLYDELNENQKRFVIGKMKNLSDAEAYRQAGYTAKEGDSFWSSVSRVANNNKVRDFLKTWENEELWVGCMGRQEMIHRLTAMARTDVTDLLHIVTPDTELMNVDTGELVNGQSFWQLKRPEDLPPGSLSSVKRLKATAKGLEIELHDQRDAMKQLAEIMGYNKPQQHEIATKLSLDEFYEDIAGNGDAS